MVVITWGKHKGKELAEISMEFPSYMRFFHDKCIEHNDTKMLEAIEEEIRRERYNPNAVYVGFGKHADCTVRDVIGLYPEYAKWMFNSDWVRTQRPKVHTELTRWLTTA